MKENKSFNIYYINLSKVYEIAMMINNVILDTVQKEKGLTREKYKKSYSSSEATWRK